MPPFGVWDPCGNPRPHRDRECKHVDGCWVIVCGSGVCRDLLYPTGNNSTEHYACDVDPHYAEVVVGGTHKTCRNNCCFGYEVVEGQGFTDVNECVLWGVSAACFVRLPRWFREDGKSHCRIEMCGVAPIGTQHLRMTLENYRMDVQYATHRTRATHSRMACWVHPRCRL